MYSQNDPRWASQVLGFGPAQYTIGSDGCYLTSDAQLMQWVGHDINPSDLNELYKANGIFVQGDLLTDAAIHDAFPGLWTLESVYHCESFPCDQNQLNNDDPTLYVVVEIMGPQGLTHFSPVTDWRNWKIADVWDGVERTVGERGAAWGWGSDSATLIGKVMHLRYIGGGAAAITETTMYDSITATDIPADVPAVAGYANGLYKWSKADWDRFSTSIKVSIAVNAQFNGGEVLDCETGDATPDECPGWIRMRQAAGLAKPTIYCNESTMPAVQRACAGLDYWLWIANYGVPGTSGYGKPKMIPGAAVVQYADPAAGSGGHYDLSTIYDPNWPTAGAGGGDDFMATLTPEEQKEVLTGIRMLAEYVTGSYQFLGAEAKPQLVALFNLIAYGNSAPPHGLPATPGPAPNPTIPVVDAHVSTGAVVTVDAAAVAAALAANPAFLAAIAKAVNDDLAKRVNG